MLVLITYDVNTEDAAGRKRLRQIAKQCVNYGQRVQNSVFECLLDTAQCRSLQHKLCQIIDPEAGQPAILLSGEAVREEDRTLRLQTGLPAGGYADGVKAGCEAEANGDILEGSHRGIDTSAPEWDDSEAKSAGVTPTVLCDLV